MTLNAARTCIVISAMAVASLIVCTPANAKSCTGLPAAAVTTLPQPLARWAALVCTPYGQIISNHQEWIWSKPGSYSPVFVPSQMVVSDPKPLGSGSYFTNVTIAKVAGGQFQSAYSAFHKGFASDPQLPDGYRLDVMSVSGKKLVLYFFDYRTHAWGLWCPEEKCKPESRFMILNVAHKPN